MVGDELLDSLANTLRKLVNQHIFDATKPELYIHREYHVEAFHDSEVKCSYNNILRKVRNNLTAALNKFPTVLPEYLIIVVGNTYVHDQIFVEMEFKLILKKIFNDVTRLLSSRKEQLPPRVQGGRATQIFVTRPLPKPATALKGDQKFKNTRRYLNQMLDRLSKTCDFKPLNIDEINCSQKVLFEKNGTLSDYGKERMWCSISDFIKQKDTQYKVAMLKSLASREEVATQVKPDMITRETSEKPDEYFTSAKRDRERDDQAWNHWNHDGQPQQDYARVPTRARSDNFDDYHRRYDRASFYDRDEHYQY